MRIITLDQAWAKWIYLKSRYKILKIEFGKYCDAMRAVGYIIY